MGNLLAIRDHISHILKNSLETRHKHLKSSHFSIIFRNFNRNRERQKIAELLLMKQLRPTLNIHDESVSLKLLK